MIDHKEASVMLKVLAYVPSDPEIAKKLAVHDIDVIWCESLEELKSKVLEIKDIIAVCECSGDVVTCKEVREITSIPHSHVIVVAPKAQVNYDGHLLLHWQDGSSSFLDLTPSFRELATFIYRVQQSIIEGPQDVLKIPISP